MSDLNNMLEGTKILSLTDANGRAHEFISETEQEKAGFKLKYYMWLSRLFILFAIVSLLVFMSTSLAIFKLAPQVTVEPFLIINQDTSDGIVRAEAITNRMASKNQLMETFVQQYVILRNTIINDEREMQTRWYPGGMLSFLSSPRVYNEFTQYRESIWGRFATTAWSGRWKLFPSESLAGSAARFGRLTLKLMSCLKMPWTKRPKREF